MENKEKIIKNILTILYAKSKIEKEEKLLLEKLLKELEIDNNYFNEIFSSWKEKPTNLEYSANIEENYSIIAFMICSLYFKLPILNEELIFVKQFTKKINLSLDKIEEFVKKTQNISFSNKIIPTAENIKKIILQENKATTNDKRLTYVATQITKEGLDELQALFLCYNLRLNVALDGSPGVGKTQSVLDLSKILEVKLFTKICSGRTTESHIISHPVLNEKNGVTITEHQNGPLCLAMETPAIFYGDEYNLLKEDVQKRLNSAFDDRRYIDRNDGVQIVAKEGFFAIISYNPSQNINTRDLEDSVADRFVHFHYKEWHSDLKAYIALNNSKYGIKRYKYDSFNIELEERGISKEGIFFVKTKKDEKEIWVNFFTKEEAKEKPEFTYYAHKIKNLSNDDAQTRQTIKKLEDLTYNEIELSRIFSRFAELVNDLSVTGKSPLLLKIGIDDFNKNDDLELLSVHKTSTRILSAALKHYNYLIEHGFNKYLAQSYSTSIIINQMCYGGYRNRKVKEIPNYEILNKIATAFGLYFDGNNFNTNLVKKNIL
ncbi:MAG: hypothetical protein A2086_05810 [Spirochaetes bacterium GWD1_27_9]|nr:MAG: hypothetical protein A2Z98_04620 [Spirochaetes bacterium GWB1_27_13]OHD35292.1 MAG: hypothetical protein A2086_05810 [Spirochaetes bacterium GWD1_27_9]